MILDDIKRSYSTMHGAERRVADYILEHPDETTSLSMADLSERTKTSDATVLRMCRTVGQSGFYQFKMNLAIEQNTDVQTLSWKTENTNTIDDVVDLLNQYGKEVAAISKNLSQDSINNAVKMIKSSNRVYCFGWGNTNPIAADMAHRLLRFGIHSFSSDNIEYIMRGVVLAEPTDSFIAYSHSGNSIYTIDCMKLAKNNGLKVILITGALNSNAAECADVTLATGTADDIRELGRESHVSELIVSDILLHFLGDQVPTYTAGSKSEAILAQFKL